jgi:hypothetical protein
VAVAERGARVVGRVEGYAVDQGMTGAAALEVERHFSFSFLFAKVRRVNRG